MRKSFIKKLIKLKKITPIQINYISITQNVKLSIHKEQEISIIETKCQLIKKDISYYNNKILFYLKNNLLKKFKSTLLKIKKKNIDPNIVTYTIIIENFINKDNQSFDEVFKRFPYLSIYIFIK
jgi:hypothetical protein